MKIRPYYFIQRIKCAKSVLVSLKQKDDVLMVNSKEAQANSTQVIMILTRLAHL